MVNGRVARRLRKEAYGDLSQRGEREYSFFTTVKKYFTEKFNKKGERIIQDENRTTFVCKGPRKTYLLLKAKHKGRG